MDAIKEARAKYLTKYNEQKDRKKSQSNIQFIHDHYEREKIIEHIGRDGENKIRKAEIAHINIVQIIFDKCCNASDQQWLKIIEDTGEVDNIVLFEVRFPFGITSNDIVNINLIDSLREYDIDQYEVYIAFKYSGMTKLTHRVHRPNSPFDKWLIHIVTTWDILNPRIKIVMGKKNPKIFCPLL